MRVDKYLWSVRYYKTRSIATQACKKGAVRVNDATVSPQETSILETMLHLERIK